MFMFFGLAATALAGTSVPDVDSPLRLGAKGSADAAVVIGIEDYAFLPDVPYAARDAEAFYNTMIYTRGLPAEQVQLLKGANRDQVVRALATAKGQVSSGGTLWVYFAGHGATSQDGDLMLVGDDAKRDAAVFQDRSISVGELEKMVPSNAVMVIDACHAGVGRGGETLIEDARFAVPTYAGRQNINHYVWTAASPSQISTGYAPAEHGLFTYFVLGAMRGWADGELDGQANGEVTLEESQAFVRRALASLNKRGQTPTLNGPNPAAVRISNGRLEAGPDLMKLPVGTESKSTALVQVVSTDGFARPFSHISGKNYEDATGRAVTQRDLNELIEGSAAGLTTRKRLGQAGTMATVGTAGTIIGGIASVIGISIYGSKMSSYNSNGDDSEVEDPALTQLQTDCDDGDAWSCNQVLEYASINTSLETTPASKPSIGLIVPGIVITSGSAALLGIGINSKAKLRREMAKVASETVVQ
jgi:hypothetical protein